jgi:hypothetical protein
MANKEEKKDVSLVIVSCVPIPRKIDQVERRDRVSGRRGADARRSQNQDKDHGEYTRSSGCRSIGLHYAENLPRVRKMST